jgi:hypothetical protein
LALYKYECVVCDVQYHKENIPWALIKQQNKISKKQNYLQRIIFYILLMGSPTLNLIQILLKKRKILPCTPGKSFKDNNRLEIHVDKYHIDNNK